MFLTFKQIIYGIENKDRERVVCAKAICFDGPVLLARFAPDSDWTYLARYQEDPEGWTFVETHQRYTHLEVEENKHE